MMLGFNNHLKTYALVNFRHTRYLVRRYSLHDKYVWAYLIWNLQYKNGVVVENQLSFLVHLQHH